VLLIQKAVDIEVVRVMDMRITVDITGVNPLRLVT
jgi:hypothetical protein